MEEVMAILSKFDLYFMISFQLLYMNQFSAF